MIDYRLWDTKEEGYDMLFKLQTKLHYSKDIGIDYGMGIV